MSTLSRIFGISLIVAGVVGGVYAGLVWAFIGGIIQIIEQIRAINMDSAVIAWGVAKILFAGAIGGVAAWAFILPGIGLFTHADTIQFRRIHRRRTSSVRPLAERFRR